MASLKIFVMFNLKCFFKMKKNYVLTAVLALGILLPFFVRAQVSTFDDLSLEPESYWNGSDLNGGFLSGNAYFFNSYDTTYGSWDGFAYSDVTNDTTPGWGNQYSAITGSGIEGSANYALAHVPSNWMDGTYDPMPVSVKLQSPLAGTVIKGVYVTNSTYAALSMLNGDAYAKKFGGETGNDADWFLLIIRGYNQGVFTDSINFYLADYRFQDNNKDYIIKYWAYINMESLGAVDSLTFSLRSSDVGEYGMNTPAYFCMENLNGLINGIDESRINNISIYPNPVQNQIHIKSIAEAKVILTDITGKTLLSTVNNNGNMQIDLSNYPRGVYFITIVENKLTITKKIIKR